MHFISFLAVLVSLVALSSSAPIPRRGRRPWKSVQKSSSKGTYSGQATYFYQEGGTGACGSVRKDSSYIVALNTAQYSSGNCGKKVKITNTSNGKSVTATVADECPGCASHSLDLSTGAFDSIGDEDTGVLPIKWSYTS
ncbi:hypothetical protein P7C70_g829, partial [Phenoliferia sp. Uapishka_3]